MRSVIMSIGWVGFFIIMGGLGTGMFQAFGVGDSAGMFGILFGLVGCWAASREMK